MFKLTVRAVLVLETKCCAQSQRGLASGSVASIIKRKHVTSSRHSAEATFSPDATFENLATLKKLKPSTDPIRLPPTIKLTLCPSQFLEPGYQKLPGSDPSNYETSTLVQASQQQQQQQSLAISQRPLVLLFAWMLSEEKHIDKYRHFWYRRGFDVLSVRTTPFDLLLPTLGGAKTGRILYDYLKVLQPRYDEILVHAFSVGGYQLSMFLRHMERCVAEGDYDGAKLAEAFRGWIIDSCVFAGDCAPGLSRAITTNAIVQPAIEAMIHAWLKVTHSFTLDQYFEVQNYLHGNRRRVPGLVFYSEDDVVSSVNINRHMFHLWQEAGIPCVAKCWQKSVHVMHYREHQEEYEHLVDRFLAELTHITKNVAHKVGNHSN